VREGANRAVATEGSRPFAGSCGVWPLSTSSRNGRVRWLVLESVQAGADFGCVVVEDASFEGGQVTVDGGVVLNLVLNGGELFGFRG
jgi:hypothetical protein